MSGPGGTVSESRRRRFLEHTVAAVLCLAFALGTLPGFLERAPGHLTPDLQDPLLNLFLMKWGAHQWRLGLPDFWNANFFFPTRGVMALGDHLIGPALLMAGLNACGASPILSYNLILLIGFAVSPFAFYLLLRRLDASWPAALVAALGWGFAACRVAHAAHLQLLLAMFIPALFWCLDRLLERPSWGRAAALCAVYGAHLSGGSYLAYMVHVPLVAVVAARFRDVRAALFRPRSLAPLAGAAVGCAALALVIYLPYARLSREIGVARTSEEWERFGARATSFLVAAPGTALDLEPMNRFRSTEGELSPGALIFALAVVGLVFGRPLSRSPLARGLCLGSLLSLALAFAPVFSIATRVLPGLDGMRVPSRFVQLALLGAALLAAGGVDGLLARFGDARARAGIAALLVALLAVELLPSRARWTSLGDEADFAAVDHWLAGQDEVRAYVDLPLPPARRLSREFRAMYHSSLHWKPLVNGLAGYVTPTWRRIYDSIQVMPDGAAIRMLADLGVTHLVVRERAMYEGGARRQSFIQWTESFDRHGIDDLELVYSDAEGDRVYRIVGAVDEPPSG